MKLKHTKKKHPLNPDPVSIRSVSMSPPVLHPTVKDGQCDPPRSAWSAHGWRWQRDSPKSPSLTGTPKHSKHSKQLQACRCEHQIDSGWIVGSPCPASQDLFCTSLRIHFFAAYRPSNWTALFAQGDQEVKNMGLNLFIDHLERTEKKDNNMKLPSQTVFHIFRCLRFPHLLSVDLLVFPLLGAPGRRRRGQVLWRSLTADEEHQAHPLRVRRSMTKYFPTWPVLVPVTWSGRYPSFFSS